MKFSRSSPRAMTEKLKTKLSTIFTSPRSSKRAEANGDITSPPSTPSRRTTMPSPTGPLSLSSSPPALRTNIFTPSSSNGATAALASTAAPNGSPALPSRPQLTRPPLFSKSSTPLPSKMRHNSYPTPHTTSSSSVGLRSKVSSRPNLFISRNERNARERRIATNESEACKADLLKQGIRTRDFQRENDERASYLRSEAALRRWMEQVSRLDGERGVGKTAGGGEGDSGRLPDAEESSRGSGDRILFEGRLANAEKVRQGKKSTRSPSR